MKRLVNALIIFSLAVAFAYCSSKKENLVQAPRDITITPENAYNNLFLDSQFVDQFLKQDTIEIDNIVKITDFYNSRNYQFAWFDNAGITEQGEAFWSLYQTSVDSLNDSSMFSGQLNHDMGHLLNEADTVFSKNDLRRIELGLTVHFFTYLNRAFKGKVSPEEMQWHIPRRKVDEQALINSFIEADTIWKPLNESFYRLQNKVMQYAHIVKDGGWPPIEMNQSTILRGKKSADIKTVKKRLKISGDFISSDTSDLFTDKLETVIMKMQRSYGLKETGAIDVNLIKELNVSASERIIQMKINLERMRWLPEEEPNRIVANIPEFKLHVYEENEEVINMNIVVGKAANRTVIFSDQLQHIVFSPYWNIPRSIVKKEIVPAMNKSKSYLSRNNMEITSYSNGLPVVRQKSGESNALGKVKFIFPNRYNIYFHDTPAKTLFSRQTRAFSHGCIRIEEPFRLAKHLLKNDKSWSEEKIRSAMNRNIEKWVKLENEVPVYIIYLTSWVNSDGLVHFRQDIYGHDKRMYDHLFHKSQMID
ncbi:MAG: L,D-transpeptidase family protein [Flavisolibacter sp.]